MDLQMILFLIVQNFIVIDVMIPEHLWRVEIDWPAHITSGQLTSVIFASGTNHIKRQNWQMDVWFQFVLFVTQ